MTPAGNSTAREPVFHIRGLARVYGEGTSAVTALRGVDFDLFRSELIVLLGASGSGKSTLLNQLGGLDSPTHGTLLYHGADLARFDEVALTQFRRNAVGFVFHCLNCTAFKKHPRPRALLRYQGLVPVIREHDLLSQTACSILPLA